MDSLNICWRGPPGTGKREALTERLKQVAALRGVPFGLQTKLISGSVGQEDADAEEESTAGQITYESSLVHIGFDIARMSMQDKQVLRPIFANLGQGSQVLAGNQGRGARILVLYHAHLLSSESVLLLQACLEQNEGDISVWITSELPVSHRIRDWFVEVPVAGVDRGFKTYAENSAAETDADWPAIFNAILHKWCTHPPPTIDDVRDVKAFVYELLMRNLRWVEATHYLLDCLITNTEISFSQRRRCIQALANCHATAGGYTIPSYRIPILWESVFLQFRTILSSTHRDASSDSTVSS
jgi:hypothetical protein